MTTAVPEVVALYHKLVSYPEAFIYQLLQQLFPQSKKSLEKLWLDYFGHHLSNYPCLHPLELWQVRQHYQGCPNPLPVITPQYPLREKNHVGQILYYRHFIKCLILGTAKDITKLSEELLQQLYYYYNYYFFGNTLPQQIILSFSNKLQKTSGQTQVRSISSGRCYTIKISLPLFKNIMAKEKPFKNYYTTLGALQMTIEHELIHLSIFVNNKYKPGRDRIYSAHGLLFKEYAIAVFGEVFVCHNFLQENSLQKEDLHIGKLVSFSQYQGIIVKINKTRVLVWTGTQIYTVSITTLKKHRDAQLQKLADDLHKRIVASKKLLSNTPITYYSKGGLLIRQGIFLKYRGDKLTLLEGKTIDPWQFIS